MTIKLKDSTSRIKEILAKGQDMTTSEVYFLKNKGFTNVEIAKVLKVSSTTVGEMLKNFEGAGKLRSKPEPKPKPEKKKENFDGMSNKEIVYKLTREGLSPREVFEKTGLGMQSIYGYRSMLKKEMEQKEGKPKEVEPVKKQEEGPDYEMIAVESSKENVRLKKQIKELEVEKAELEEEVAGLKLMAAEPKQNNSFEKKYRKSKKQHELLLSYLALSLDAEA